MIYVVSHAMHIRAIRPAVTPLTNQQMNEFRKIVLPRAPEQEMYFLNAIIIISNSFPLFPSALLGSVLADDHAHHHHNLA